jgi:hypothetical protein
VSEQRGGAGGVESVMRADTKIAAAGATGGVERHLALIETVRLLVFRRADDLRIEAISDPSDPDRALDLAGGLLASPHATLAGPTFEQWFDAAAVVPR